MSAFVLPMIPVPTRVIVTTLLDSAVPWKTSVASTVTPSPSTPVSSEIPVNAGNVGTTRSIAYTSPLVKPPMIAWPARSVMPVPASFKSRRNVPSPETPLMVTAKFCGKSPTWLMLCTTPAAVPVRTSVKSETSAPLIGSENATRKVTFVAEVGLVPPRVIASTVGRMVSKTTTSKFTEAGLTLLAASVAMAVKKFVPTGSKVFR